MQGHGTLENVDDELSSKTTGDDGTATWSWRTDSNTKGSYPIEVQCVQGDKKGSLSTNFVVY